MRTEIDTSNYQAVGVLDDQWIVVVLPARKMTKREALRHAAWLVVLADDHDEFPAILEAVRGT